MKRDISTLKGILWVSLILIILNLPLFLNKLKIEKIDFQNEAVESIAASPLYSAKEIEDKIWRYVREGKMDEVELKATLGEDVKIIKEKGRISKEEYLATQKLKPPFKLLIVGDSFIITGLGPQLENTFSKYSGVEIKRFGKIGAGFVGNNVVYDWNAKIKELANSFQPDVVLISLGANDVNPTSGFTFYQQQWRDIYRQRSKSFMKAVPTNIKKVYWIGHSISTNSVWNEGIVIIDKILKEECEAYINCQFIPTWDRFLVNGGYSTFILDDSGKQIRHKDSDGIHLSKDGSNLTAKLTVDFMSKDINFN